MPWYDDYIIRIPGIQGGFPVIRGTRTPIRCVVLSYQIYDSNIEQVRRALPHLSAREIRAALDYYRDQPDLVDADIRRQQEALAEFLQAQ